MISHNGFSLKIKNRVVFLAALGRHRKLISRHLKVGIGYVEQVIAYTPGLVDWRKKLKIFQQINLPRENLKRREMNILNGDVKK